MSSRIKPAKFEMCDHAARHFQADVVEPALPRPTNIRRRNEVGAKIQLDVQVSEAGENCPE